MRLFAILFLLALAPFTADAQIIPTLESPIEIRAIPAVPAPGQAVTLTAANVNNKNSTTFIWTVDGRVVEQGLGLDQITLRSGTIGSRTSVSVTVRNGSETVGTKTYTLVPGELDIVWEANTYTPPFYIGRPVPTGDSLITIATIPSAIVNGTRLNASSLSYQWYINNSQTPYQTGYGLSSISITPPLFDSAFSVRVVASTPDGSFSLQGTEIIVPQTPETLLYQKHPLLGVLFNRALSTGFLLPDEEVTLRLFPLFLSGVGNAVYSWKVNNDSVDTSDAPRELTLRKTGSGVGFARVSAMFEVENSLYERAEQNVEITF